MKNKKVVYTCITGAYDLLYDHKHLNSEWDYICFSDTIKQDQNNQSWKIRPLEYKQLDDVRNQRWHKINAHKILSEYEHSVYLDANIEITGDDFFEKVNKKIHTNSIISMTVHPERDCVYDELQACINLKKDDKKIMRDQIEYLKRDKFPAKQGLYACGIIYRRHNDKKIVKIMDDWWKMVKMFSKRDQLSFTYVLWKNEFKEMNVFDFKVYEDNEYLHYWPHTADLRNTIYEAENVLKNQQDIIDNFYKQSLEDQKYVKALEGKIKNQEETIKGLEEAISELKKKLSHRVYDAVKRLNKSK
jgi:uncharacterized coiled-coil protein SlyX